MTGIDNRESLMVWLINYLADTFGNRAILKGGMELRLLDCPRHTNDIDYVFAPFTSKKEIADQVLGALNRVPELHVTHSLNSRCVRCLCEYGRIRVQIEINAATSCATQELTTAGLARKYNLQGRIVRGMRFDVALAHKLAAWNERGLIRDLYDCYYLAEVVAVRPNLPTLTQRLAKTELRVGRTTKKKSFTTAEFMRKLEDAVAALNDDTVAAQMRDYLRREELPGLDKKMRIGLTKLLEFLAQVS